MAKKIEVDLQKVEALASRGLTLEQVADNLNVTRKTFYTYRKDNPAIEEAYQRGKSKGVQVIANALWEKAKNGDNTAMIFYLKCNGWKEAQEVTIKKEDVEKDIKDLSYSELIALAGEDKKKTTKEKIDNE